jgi:hypothetical protein
MPLPSHQRSKHVPREIEVVTNWPTVFMVVGLTLVFLVGPLAAAIWFTRPVAVASKESLVITTAKAQVSVGQFLPWTTLSEVQAPPKTDEDSEPIVAEILPPPLRPPPLFKGESAELLPYRPEEAKKTKHESRPVDARADDASPADSNWGEWLPADKHRYLLSTMVPEVNWTDGEEWAQAVKKRKYPESWNKLTSSALHTPAWLSEVANRPDLRGLPVRMGPECQMDPTTAYFATSMSRVFREELGRPSEIIPTGSQARPIVPSDEGVNRALARFKYDPCVMNLGILMQIVQAEGLYPRLKLVSTLSDIPGQAASAALARLAIFDLDSDVRKSAILALASRPRVEYLDELLSGFRYPWPQVAENAAFAAVDLKLRELTLRLVDMLDLPDPSAPFLNANNQWVQKKLVRVNHLRNCFLCHAASNSAKDDPVRGFVPTPGAPIRQYYNRQQGLFVRADVTYLRQDFSVVLPVPYADPWPRAQRFDFLVMTRELPIHEATGLSLKHQPESTNFPQREAVLTALRGLTGADAGSSAEEWRRLLWPKEFRSSSVRTANHRGLLAARIHRTASRR